MYASIEGKGRVFAKEHDGWTSYTLGISTKDKDGRWISAYQPVRFKSGVSVPNGTDITFKAFPTVKERIIDGKNRNFVMWQILEYAADEIPQSDPEWFTSLETGDIPF